MSTPSSSLEASLTSPPPSAKDRKGSRAIPFLRQLTEMLQSNEELISFVPGQRLPNETIPAKIVVHDRNRVQSEVLPVYFNHASFASLRRQLSYFSFVRVGKSRQSGVTYTNSMVVAMADILKLKRRAVGAQAKAGGAARQKQKRQKTTQPPQEQPSSQPSSQPHPVKNRQPQEQQQQLMTSAVLSGTLHAAKTNHDLDINVGPSLPSAAEPKSSSSSLCCCHSGSTARSSNLIFSRSLSSFSSSNNASADNNASSGKKSSSKNSSKKQKKRKAHKRKGMVIPKKLRRKDRKRADRLLSINNIVPFIHLPERRPRKKKAGSSTGESNTASNSKKIQKENKQDPPEHAIHALLALGTNKQ